MFLIFLFIFFFFFNDTATTEIYTLSLHDALPVSTPVLIACSCQPHCNGSRSRSEEHTSELQSRVDLVCRLLLEKKNKIVDVRRSGEVNDVPHDREGVAHRS